MLESCKQREEGEVDQKADRVIKLGVIIAIVAFIVGTYIDNTLNTKNVAAVQEPPRKVKYVVTEDTKFFYAVWDIAVERYPSQNIITTWDLIRKTNGIVDFDLKAGQILILPEVVE